MSDKKIASIHIENAGWVDLYGPSTVEFSKIIYNLHGEKHNIELKKNHGISSNENRINPIYSVFFWLRYLKKHIRLTNDVTFEIDDEYFTVHARLGSNHVKHKVLCSEFLNISSKQEEVLTLFLADEIRSKLIDLLV